MNITFFFGGFAPIGGIERSVFNLLTALIRPGIGILLVCWGPNSQLIELLRRHNIRVLRTPFRWGCRWSIPDWVLCVRFYRRISNSEVVLFGKFVPGPVIKMLRRAVSRSCAFVFVTPYRPCIPESGDEIRKTFEKYNLYDEVWVQSRDFELDLRRIGYSKRIRVLPYMSNARSEILDYPRGDIRIGFLGRLVEDKNVELIIRAFAYLKETPNDATLQVSSMRLDIFGDGSLRSELTDLVSELGLERDVTFWGAVPPMQVADAIPRCHVFVFASRIEGQCLAALEILSCGRPIVATPVGAFPEILCDPKLGVLLQRNRPEDIAAGLATALNLQRNGGLTPKSIREAYERRYGPRMVGQLYQEAFLDLIGGFR